MKYKFGKIFKRYSDLKLNIEVIEYDPSKDNYYKLIKDYRELGYEQIIISSKLMVDILKKYFFEKRCNIRAIELLEEDRGLENELKNILTKTKEDRAYFNVLVEKVIYLIDTNSIDLRKIEFTWRDDEETTSIFIQVNGVIGITSEKYLEEVEHIKNYIFKSIKI